MCWAPSLLDVNSALCCNYRPQSKQSMRSFALYLCTEGKPYLKTSLILPNSHTIKCCFSSCRLQHFCNYFHVSIRHIFRSLFSFFVHIIPVRWIPFTTIFCVVSFLIWNLLEDTESLLYHSHFVWKTLKNITGQTMLSIYIYTLKSNHDEKIRIFHE